VGEGKVLMGGGSCGKVDRALSLMLLPTVRMMGATAEAPKGGGVKRKNNTLTNL